MAVKVITPPTTEQISLTDAYAHLRLDGYGSPIQHPDDALITALIGAAREYCEGWTGRALAPQVVEMALDRFSVSAGGVWCGPKFYRDEILGTMDEIQLPLSPVAGVVSVTYVDADGTQQAVDPSNYVIDNYQQPGWLFPASGYSWPATSSVINAVKIRLNVGYTRPTDSPDDMPLPKSIRAAMLLTLGHLYENREATTDLKLEQLPLGVAALLEPWRQRLSMA